MADICAFGPRNYANEVRVPPGELHNKTPKGSAAATMMGPLLGLPPAGLPSGRRGGGVSGGKRTKNKHVYCEDEFELDSSYRYVCGGDSLVVDQVRLLHS